MSCDLIYASTGAARFMFKGVEVPEHSLVVRETVGSANADTLMCESDYTQNCCTNMENGWFYDYDNPPGSGNPRPVSTVSSSGWYQSRDTGVVRLHLHFSGTTSEGIFFCEIRVSATDIQTLYVGVYPLVDDGFGGDGKSV